MSREPGIFEMRLWRSTSVSLFSCVPAIVGAVLDFADLPPDIAVFAIAVLGIVAVGYASAELIRESLLSLQVIESHVDQIMERMVDESATH
ncbi:MAG: hypothetical protein GYB65_03190 [Chloroflexi bacterium]|nr:hypothetical protein [Chloroflexota bacterium]